MSSLYSSAHTKPVFQLLPLVGQRILDICNCSLRYPPFNQCGDACLEECTLFVTWVSQNKSNEMRMNERDICFPVSIHLFGIWDSQSHRNVLVRHHATKWCIYVLNAVGFSVSNYELLIMLFSAKINYSTIMEYLGSEVPSLLHIIRGILHAVPSHWLISNSQIISQCIQLHKLSIVHERIWSAKLNSFRVISDVSYYMFLLLPWRPSVESGGVCIYIYWQQNCHLARAGCKTKENEAGKIHTRRHK